MGLGMKDSQKLFTDEDAKEFFSKKELRPYQPSNGTEGEMFMERWCHRCMKDENQDCDIIARTFVYDVKDPDYPKEWRWNGKGQPECTAFEEKK